MANTTFSGPVRSQNGFQSISIDSTSGAVTVNSSFGTDVVLGTQSLSGAGAVDVTNAFTWCVAGPDSCQRRGWRNEDHRPRG
jgi:hypothetical protein